MPGPVTNANRESPFFRALSFVRAIPRQRMVQRQQELNVLRQQTRARIESASKNRRDVARKNGIDILA